MDLNHSCKPTSGIPKYLVFTALIMSSAQVALNMIAIEASAPQLSMTRITLQLGPAPNVGEC